MSAKEVHTMEQFGIVQSLTGVLINSVGVLFAGILGVLFKKGLSPKMKDTLMIGLGFCVLYIGISGISADTNITMLVISVSIGAFFGELIDIDRQLNRFAAFVEKKLPFKNENIADGFLSSSLFVCVGAMSIVGGIESGTQGTYQIFLAKTFIDSIVIFVMAATKGLGCCLSAFVALAYQTLVTVSAGYIGKIVTDLTISQMSEIGSLLIIGIAFNLLNIIKVKIGNFILCPFIPVLIFISSQIIK